MYNNENTVTSISTGKSRATQHANDKHVLKEDKIENAINDSSTQNFLILERTRRSIGELI